MTDSVKIPEDLQQELDALRHDNALLLGLMAGGYAYFLRQLMVGHQQGLSPTACEQTIVDALKRVLSTQERFGCEYLAEIEAALANMTQTVPLESYLKQITAARSDSKLEKKP
ncbi:hypothetical protein [Altericista sp. CCNU0014]|uniref:hypothetical protein n=1 Tax=Altericista sp. CCNU0014 TaxID=3082949 RepID=UPI00384C0777